MPGYYKPDIGVKKDPDEGDMVSLISKLFTSAKYAKMYAGDTEYPTDKQKYAVKILDEEQSIRMINPISDNGALPKDYTSDMLEEDIINMQNKRLNYDNSSSGFTESDNFHLGQDVNEQLGLMIKHRDRLDRKEARFINFNNTLTEFNDLYKGEFKDGRYNPSGDNQSAKMMDLVYSLETKFDVIDEKHINTISASALKDLNEVKAKTRVIGLLSQITNKQEDFLWNEKTGEFDTPKGWGPQSKVYMNEAMDKLQFGDVLGAQVSIDDAVREKAAHLGNVFKLLASSDTQSDIQEINDEMFIKKLKNMGKSTPSKDALEKGGNAPLANAIGDITLPANTAGPYAKGHFDTMASGLEYNIASTFGYLFQHTNMPAGKIPRFFGGEEIIKPENRNKIPAFVKWHLGQIDIVQEKNDKGKLIWQIKDVVNDIDVPTGKIKEGGDYQGERMDDRLSQYDYTQEHNVLGSIWEKLGYSEYKIADERGKSFVANLLKTYDMTRDYANEKNKRADTWAIQAFKTKLDSSVGGKDIKIKVADFKTDPLTGQPIIPFGTTVKDSTEIEDVAALSGSFIMSNRVYNIKRKWSRIQEGKARHPQGTPPSIDTEAKFIMYNLLKDADKRFGYKTSDVDNYLKYQEEASKTNKDIIPFIHPDKYEDLKNQVFEIMENAKWNPTKG